MNVDSRKKHKNIMEEYGDWLFIKESTLKGMPVKARWKNKIYLYEYPFVLLPIKISKGYKWKIGDAIKIGVNKKQWWFLIVYNIDLAKRISEKQQQTEKTK